MTLEQLRIFVAVADKEHLERGAGALRITQPVASAAIADLESSYGTRLFDRIGRRVRLTDAGKEFFFHAKQLLANAEAVELILRDLGGVHKGVICVGASQTIANYWLPARLVDFRKEFPHVDIEVQLGNTEQVAEWVTEGTVQVGLIEGYINESSLTELIVGVDQLCLVASSEHKWPSSVLSQDDLISAQWILREKGSGTRSEFENVLRVRGVDPLTLNILLELPSNEAVREAVEAGAGVSVLSESVVERSLKLGSLKRISIDLPKRAFRLIQHRERYRARAVVEFCASLQRMPNLKRVS